MYIPCSESQHKTVHSMLGIPAQSGTFRPGNLSKMMYILRWESKHKAIHSPLWIPSQKCTFRAGNPRHKAVHSSLGIQVLKTDYSTQNIFWQKFLSILQNSNFKLFVQETYLLYLSDSCRCLNCSVSTSIFCHVVWQSWPNHMAEYWKWQNMEMAENCWSRNVGGTL